jgi:hypothetical protein
MREKVAKKLTNVADMLSGFIGLTKVIGESFASIYCLTYKGITRGTSLEWINPKHAIFYFISFDFSSFF